MSAVLAAAASTGLAVTARYASAGNVDTFMLGNDAVMMGGAVTATARGSTAIWYNPAGLVGEKFQSVDVSFNAYAIRFGGSPDLTVDESRGGSRMKLTTLDFSPVPTTLAYTRRIGTWQVGAGLFVPNRSVSFPRTLVRVSDGDRVTTVAQDGNSRFSEYYAGLSVGRALTPRFRIGVGLFGYFSSQVDTETLSVGSATPSSQIFAYEHATIDQIRLGSQLVWGLQWSPKDDWQLGVTFRSPVLSAYQLTQIVNLSGASVVEGEATSSADFQEKTGGQRVVLRPMRVHLGGGWKRDRWQVGLDGSVQAPHRADRVEDSTNAVWNVRAGVLHTFSEKLAVGGGVFTDLSPYDATTSVRHGSIDYYGVSVALRLGELLIVRSEDDARARSLIFGSTFALSYALGTGVLGNQELSPVQGGARTALRLDSVTAHEFVLHVGSTLSR